MKAIEAPNITVAWLAAMEYLLSEPKQKAVNLAVAFSSIHEAPAVRSVLDDFLATAARRRREALYPVETVASTLFPEEWYVPDRAEHPRRHLYECHALAQRVHKRLTGEAETYFNRLVHYPTNDGTHVNQLEEQIARLQGQLRTVAPKSSAYEIGVSLPGDLRVQIPGQDKLYMGFPCLSHISLTLHAGALHMTATYRNQGFLRKAYGNYIGLARLLRFVAREIGVAPGEIMCIATHADAESAVGTVTGVRKLLASCREALDAELYEVDRAA